MINAIKKIKGFLAIAIVAGVSIVPVMAPVAVHAQGASDSPDIQGPLCNGTEFNFNTTSGTCTTVNNSGDKVTAIIKTVINIISVVVGVVAVIMIVFGGLKYITSGGESSNVSSAKNTILYAIIGLVIVAMAQFIVRFVLDKSINAANTTP